MWVCSAEEKCGGCRECWGRGAWKRVRCRKDTDGREGILREGKVRADRVVPCLVVCNFPWVPKGVLHSQIEMIVTKLDKGAKDFAWSGWVQGPHEGLPNLFCFPSHLPLLSFHLLFSFLFGLNFSPTPSPLLLLPLPTLLFQPPGLVPGIHFTNWTFPPPSSPNQAINTPQLSGMHAQPVINLSSAANQAMCRLILQGEVDLDILWNDGIWMLPGPGSPESSGRMGAGGLRGCWRAGEGGT